MNLSYKKVIIAKLEKTLEDNVSELILLCNIQAKEIALLKTKVAKAETDIGDLKSGKAIEK